LVLANGRIIDPETKLDAIPNLGIKDGKIGANSEMPLKGQVVVDVSGLVVAHLHLNSGTAVTEKHEFRDTPSMLVDMHSAFRCRQFFR
jgi:predicted amidohydrolase